MSCSVFFSVTNFPQMLHLWSAVPIVLGACSLVVANGLGAAGVGTRATYALFGVDSLDAKLRVTGTLRTECCLHRWNSFWGRIHSLQMFGSVPRYLKCTHMVPKPWKFWLCSGRSKCISGSHADHELMLLLCSIWTLRPSDSQVQTS